MVAAVISSEHFIAQVGAGYSQGIVIAAFGWNAWLVYTLLIWIFLPWYVAGTSMVAAVISSEHFIAQVGAGYSQGIVIAAFGWNAWLVYTLLIWIFLPYYMR